jgi:O-antigen/teichoic acid export membrane protein
MSAALPRLGESLAPVWPPPALPEPAATALPAATAETEEADPFAARHLVGRSAQGVLTALLQTGSKAAFGLVMPLLLAPTEYGTYAYLIWLATVVIQLGSLGVPQAAQRYLPSAPERLRPGIARLLGRVPYASGVLGTGVVGIWFLFARGPHLEARSVALCAVLVVPGECALIWAALLRGALRFNAIIVGEMTALVTKCLLLGTLVLRGGRVSLLEVLAAEALSVSLQALWLWRSNRQLCRRPAVALDRGLYRAIFHYALGVWSLVLIDSLLWRVEIAFLHSFVSPRAAAIFSVTTQVTQAAILLPCAAITALFPSFAGLSARRDGAAGQLYRQTAALVWTAILPFYYVATAAGLAMLLVYGARYHETLTLLPLVMVSRTMVVAACASSTLLCATGEQRQLVRIVALGAALNIAGNALLVPRFGLWGAVAGACLFQPAVSLATIWRAQRHAGCGFPIARLSAAFSFAALYLGALAYMHRQWAAVAALAVAGVLILVRDGHVRRALSTAGELLRAGAQF